PHSRGSSKSFRQHQPFGYHRRILRRLLRRQFLPCSGSGHRPAKAHGHRYFSGPRPHRCHHLLSHHQRHRAQRSHRHRSHRHHTNREIHHQHQPSRRSRRGRQRHCRKQHPHRSLFRLPTPNRHHHLLRPSADVLGPLAGPRGDIQRKQHDR